MAEPAADPAGAARPSDVARTGDAAAGARLAHQPALDGLRGVAVVAVLLFHGGFRWAKGGFLGVSVFFTLSGFLITSLLLREHETTGTISLRRFWGRRGRRLLPAAFACLVLVAVLDRAGQLPHRATTRGDLLAALANVANWRFLIDGQSYGQIFRTPSPVQHYWSLAIEEQFYLLLPLAVTFAVVRRRWSRTTLLRAAIAAFALCSAIAVASGWNNPDLAYYSTLSRAPELLAGVCLAIAVPARALAGATTTTATATTTTTTTTTTTVTVTDGLAGGAAGGEPAGATVTARWALAAAGFAALTQFAALVAGADQRGRWLSRGGLCAFALLSVALIAAALFTAPLRTLFAVEPLAAIGRMSYGIYLYHWPVFLVLSPARTGLDRGALFAVRLPVTAALAAVSYLLLEEPVRRGRVVRGRSRWVAAPLAAALTAAAALVFTGPAGSPLQGEALDANGSMRVLATSNVGAGAAGSDGAAAPANGASGGGTAGAAASSPLGAGATGTGTGTAGTGTAGAGPGGAAGGPAGSRAEAASGAATAAAASTSAPGSAGSAGSAAGAGPGTGVAGGAPTGGSAEAGSPVAAAPLRILLAGDSTANALASGLAGWAADTGSGSVVSDAIRVGCGFVTSGRDKYGAEARDIGPICGQVQSQVEQAARASNADVAVVINGVWEVTDHQAPGDEWRSPGDPVFDQRLLAALRSVSTKVLAHVPRIVWVTSPTIHPGWGFAGDDPAWDPARMARYNALVRALVDELGDRAAVVDYAGWMNDGPNGMNPDVRPDGVHASPAGARTIADWLGPRILAAATAVGPGA